MRRNANSAAGITSCTLAEVSDSDPTAESYVSAAKVREMLDGSLAARRRRLAAADMISTDEAADLVDTTKVAINTWIKQGRAIGLTQTRRGVRMPRWQFDPVVWDALQSLSTALGTTEGWALLTFLETPFGALAGRTPRQAIEQGDVERVIDLAGWEGN